MEPISAMKTLGYLLCLLISSIFITSKGCYPPFNNNDKELTELSPNDSIKIIKKQIDSTISVVEKKVNINDIEIKKVDTLLAKQLRSQPVLKPAPAQRINPKERHSWLYDLFSKSK